MSDLKPCPFCGGEPNFTGNNYAGNCYYVCENEECPDFQHGKNLWNTRAYEQRIALLTEALQYLISVKEHKDREGKTDWYEYHKELAWKQAKTVVMG